MAKPVLSPLLDYPVEAAEQLKADLLQMSLTLAEVERKLNLFKERPVSSIDLWQLSL